MKPKIAIDAIALLSAFTGIGRYAYEISKRVEKKEEFDTKFYYGFFSKKLISKNSSYKHIKSSFLKNSFLKKALKKALMFYTKNFYKENFDLYWQPNYIPSPVVKSKRCIVSVHDFSFILNPSWHPKERIDYFEKNFFKNIKRADRIITGSNYTKEEIKKYISFDENKIDVIYHGVNHSLYKRYEKSLLESFKKENRLPDRFFLFVGSIEPRKNLSYLLRVYLDLPSYIKKDYKLVIAGFKGWENERIKEILEKERENIFYMGYLDDLHLAFLYNLAFCFIYPSLYEGFGIPPLEAMACKTPVITSKVASMPEVCKDAALYIDPRNEDSLRKEILRVIENDKIREALIEKGYNRSKEFTWENSFKKHFEIFKKEVL